MFGVGRYLEPDVHVGGGPCGPHAPDPKTWPSKYFVAMTSPGACSRGVRLIAHMLAVLGNLASALGRASN